MSDVGDFENRDTATKQADTSGKGDSTTTGMSPRFKKDFRREDQFF
jgi:hypothetical protein